MISIVVPVYNEGTNIENLFIQLQSDIKTPFDVTVVYDFEEDNTLPVVKMIKGNYPFQIYLLKNAYGQGALNAIKTGLLNARNEAVLVVMADLSDSLSSVDYMYEKFAQGCDVVCGSRYMAGGKQSGGPLIKRTLSRLAGVSLNKLTGISTHDISNSFKMYSRRLIESTVIESTGGFELGMELTVKAYSSGMKVDEVPSQWYDRVGGKSNFKMWAWLPHYLHWYWYAINEKWFRLAKKIETEEKHEII